MKNLERRIEITDRIHDEIIQDLKDGKIDNYKAEEFDKRFFRAMMEQKEQGINLWWTSEEENFYRNLAGGE